MKRRHLIQALPLAFLPLSHVAQSASTDLWDVLIVGAGGAGLSAAVAAAEAGAQHILVIEKAPIAGGHTVLSAGTVTVTASDEYDPDQTHTLIRDLVRAGGREALAETFAMNATDAVQWLGEMGVAWEPKLFQAVGSGVRRNLSTGSHRGGFDIIQALSLRARDLGVKVQFETKATSLITHNGRVTGVRTQTPQGEKTFSARGVILATGGFGANKTMRRQWDPRITENVGTTADVLGLTPDGAKGDGILLGQAVGAKLVDMDAIECIPYAGGRVLDYVGAEIWLNAEGDRFVSEEATFDKIAEAMREQTGSMMWTITDSQSRKGANFGTKLANGIVRQADSLSALSQATGISLEKLSYTLNAYNRSATTGKDRRFGRTTFTQTIDVPPYYYGIEKLSVHITMGGLLIDTDARALDGAENPIPGLFAAGETTGGLHGRRRMGGNALTEVLVFGRIAGQSAARRAQSLANQPNA